MSDPTEARKPWRVIFGVPAANLEVVLNAMSGEGYQLYRMDRELINPSSMLYAYDLVLFSAAIVASKQQESLMREGGVLQDLLNKLKDNQPK